MYRFYAVTARECRGKGKSLYLNVKTTVVFTLSWAGVTPAPSIRKKGRMRADALLGGFGREDANRNSCPAVADNPRRYSPKQLLTGTKSRIFLNSKVQGLPLPKEV